MSTLRKCYRVKKGDFVRAGEASITVQGLLKSLKIDPKLIRRVAICGYECEMNVVMHGGDGQFCIEIDEHKLVLDISDDGPGIEDIPRAMQKGFSTAKDEYREMGFGAGMGLPNMEKNADKLEVTSQKGSGTTVKMIFFLNEGN